MVPMTTIGTKTAIQIVKLVIPVGVIDEIIVAAAPVILVLF